MDADVLTSLVFSGSWFAQVRRCGNIRLTPLLLLVVRTVRGELGGYLLVHFVNYWFKTSGIVFGFKKLKASWKDFKLMP